ncbi:MAG TPA: pyridoxal-phosphate dependent enzyme [Symbiobacteriaceae bacterium]|nr:pyridoxal-phosphate dependent enzyme [Symbiobacteriaceae bacterium]
MGVDLVLGPTFAEMLHPEKMEPAVRAKAIEMKTKDPLDPINLYNISWRDLATGQIWYEVLPKELTGVEAPIVVMYGKEFPSGAHKVGAAYSVLAEMTLFGQVDPAVHTVVWPSTGNYGIGGAWVGGRMGTRSIVVLPEMMSRERFERIESYGATVIKTPGCESNVKEIYDKTWELRKDPNIRILNQFEVMGNYRFHYHVTGNTIVELAQVLATQGIGKGRIAGYCSAMGSAGTIAAGDRVKQVFPEAKTVGLEPTQCPTLYNNGYGGHDIQGIGDKHVTWIHNVMNMDAIMCLDDIECKKGLQFLTEEPGMNRLAKLGVPTAKIAKLASIFGISGVCNVLGAIKMAKHYQLGADDVIVTICTDAIDRYHSVMQELTETYGVMDNAEAAARLAAIFHGQKTDWIKDGTPDMRRQWHNLKYYTWVEQQGKTVQELDAQLSQSWWVEHQQMVPEIDHRILATRR